MLDEAFSLFPGGESGPRFGGAGLQMYTLADELSKNQNLDVCWLFNSTSEKIFPNTVTHERIKIYFARDVESLNSLVCSDGSKVAISSIAASAPMLLKRSKQIDAKTILRLANDNDPYRPVPVPGYTSSEILELMKSVDKFVVQNEWQQSKLHDSLKRDSRIIPSVLTFDGMAQPKKKEHILWVASSQPLKQPWYFLDLAKSFPSEKFVMLMPRTYTRTSDFVKSQAEFLPNLGLIDRQIPLSEVQDLFLRAKVFVNTSETEGFPNTFLQAWASMTPVLSLKVNPSEVLTKHNIGFCAQWSFAALKDDLTAVLGNESLQQEVTERAYAYLCSVHSPANVAKQWLSTILEVVNAA